MKEQDILFEGDVLSYNGSLIIITFFRVDKKCYMCPVNIKTGHYFTNAKIIPLSNISHCGFYITVGEMFESEFVDIYRITLAKRRSLYITNSITQATL